MMMNEGVDPGMKGMEYRDCAKGAHMTTVKVEVSPERIQLRQIREALQGTTTKHEAEVLDDILEILTGSRN